MGTRRSTASLDGREFTINLGAFPLTRVDFNSPQLISSSRESHKFAPFFTVAFFAAAFYFKKP